MQKRAHQVRNGRIDSVPYFLEVPWIVAFLTYISGHLVCWLGLGMAPQAVLVQLNSWTVAATGVLGCIVLGETMTFQRFIFIAWLAIGCGLVVTNGPQTNTSETLASLSQRAANHNVHVCALVMISACFMVLHMRIFFWPCQVFCQAECRHTHIDCCNYCMVFIYYIQVHFIIDFDSCATC